MKYTLVLFAALSLASCQSTPSGPPVASETIACSGLAHYWTDVIIEGQKDTVSVQARWTRAIDSSFATLIVTSPRAVDTVYLHHDAQGWAYGTKDLRSHYNGWRPTLTETKDSVLLSMGFGFSGTNYFLRKN